MSQRLKIIKSLLLLLSVFILGSCMTYNYADAKSAITPNPSIAKQSVTPTKLAQLQKETVLEVKTPPLVESINTPAPEQVTPLPEKLPLSKFSAALIPLPTQTPLGLLDRIVTEIKISDIDIIGVTGEEDAVSYVETHLTVPTFRLDNRRLLATKLETAPLADQLFNIQIDPSRSVVVGILDFYPSNPFQDLLAAADREEWSGIVQAHHKEIDLPNEKGPTLLLASLGQPSSEDWFETAPGHPYRSHLRWPYSDLFGEQGFIDSWRVTHYNAETAPGTTWQYTTEDNYKYAERIDYLYSQGLLPLATETITIGPWDAFEQRSAITGTFIVP